MAWIVLVLSAVLEAVWATALEASNGFTVLLPSVIFAVAAAASMAGLGYAMKAIPISTAYAVWTGLGAVLTVAWAMATGSEEPGVLKVLFLAGIIGCVIGLKLVDQASSVPDTSVPDTSVPERPAPDHRGTSQGS